ncbi:hypothetical protein RI129_000636 [Pyrocoelia pectoralis]|uniref:Rhodanese domain-containing protein n=1 Tax=Pyrocoelia pectoralis TaxID=417401 RepID=A0AAN7ZR38_9COLE
MSASWINAVDYATVRSVKGSGMLLIDVRAPAELNESGKLPESINIPLDELEAALNKMDNKDFCLNYGCEKPNFDVPLIFSCRSGNRSTHAANIAVNLGYKNVHNYVGGWLDWQRQAEK